MRGYTVIWIGQLVSLLGTRMTWFALTLWVYGAAAEEIQATWMTLVALASFVPTVLLSPLAGALVDRWNRKLVMVLSDLAAGLMTGVVLLLYATDNLLIWHLLLTGAVSAAFQAFQFPAYSAAVSTMLPKEQYARAGGMMSLAEGASGIFGPLVGGLLLAPLGTAGIMVVDLVTFGVAIVALMLVPIPQPRASEAGRASRGSLWKESIYGFKYIWQRPSLLGLQLVFLTINLAGILAGGSLLATMVLDKTGQNERILGTVQSVSGAGVLVGGLVMSAWGGPKRRVHGVLMGMAIGLLAQMVLGVGNSLLVWAVAGFISSGVIPIIDGSNQSIWMAKVPPDIQGRVFAARRLIAQISILAGFAAGPLADFIFGPAMVPGGSLTGLFGWLTGTGPGTGIGVMFVITGTLGALAGLAAYLFPAIRNAEDLLPDHDAVAAEPAAEPA